MNSKEIIKKIGVKTLEIEAACLSNLARQIDSNFVEAVEYVFQSKGRVVLSGIGKSAIVGKKITATLNSTGTPSIFMHASDAIHGDLGTITKDDVVLLLSKSGETDEIKALIPLVKNLGNKIIAMVCQKDSSLGRLADFLLHIPIQKEADPNNLAPTTSTTAQMAMGDAIASSLLALRGFTSDDFAKFHPGGSLGKQLYMRVEDLLHNNSCPSVDIKASIRAIIVEMTSNRLGMTAVLSEDNLVGIITDGDLRRMLSENGDVSNLNAEDIMTPSPKTIDHRAMAVEALHFMREQSITQLLVTKEGNYLGVIHLHNLIAEGII